MNRRNPGGECGEPADRRSRKIRRVPHAAALASVFEGQAEVGASFAAGTGAEVAATFSGTIGRLKSRRRTTARCCRNHRRRRDQSVQQVRDARLSPTTIKSRGPGEVMIVRGSRARRGEGGGGRAGGGGRGGGGAGGGARGFGGGGAAFTESLRLISRGVGSCIGRRTGRGSTSEARTRVGGVFGGVDSGPEDGWTDICASTSRKQNIYVLSKQSADR